MFKPQNFLEHSKMNHLVLTEESVTKQLRKVNVHEAAGPDSICGRRLHHTAQWAGYKTVPTVSEKWTCPKMVENLQHYSLA